MTYTAEGGAGSPATPQDAGTTQPPWTRAKDQFEWLRAVREPEKINGLGRKQRLIAGMLATAYDRQSHTAKLTNPTFASYCGYADYESIKMEVEGLVRDGWLERRAGGMRKGKTGRIPSVYRLRIPTAVLEKMKAAREADDEACEAFSTDQRDTATQDVAPKQTATTKEAAGDKQKLVHVPVTPEDGRQAAATLHHLLQRRGRQDLADLLAQEEELWLILAKPIRPRLSEGTGWTTLDELFRAALDEVAFGELPAAGAIRESVSQFVAARTLRMTDVAAWHMLRYNRLIDIDARRAVEEKKAAARATAKAAAAKAAAAGRSSLDMDELTTRARPGGSLPPTQARDEAA